MVEHLAVVRRLLLIGLHDALIHKSTVLSGQYRNRAYYQTQSGSRYRYRNRIDLNDMQTSLFLAFVYRIWA
jgi:hypothetical protein